MTLMNFRRLVNVKKKFFLTMGCHGKFKTKLKLFAGDFGHSRFVSLRVSLLLF